MFLRHAAVGGCREDPGIALCIGGPQSCNSISGVAVHNVREYGETFVCKICKNESNYMETAIVNEICEVLGLGDAEILKQFS